MLLEIDDVKGLFDEAIDAHIVRAAHVGGDLSLMLYPIDGAVHPWARMTGIQERRHPRWSSPESSRISRAQGATVGQLSGKRYILEIRAAAT
jgi:hypothetical protein